MHGQWLLFLFFRLLKMVILSLLSPFFFLMVISWQFLTLHLNLEDLGHDKSTIKQGMDNAKWGDSLENESDFSTSILKTIKEKVVQNSAVDLVILLSFHSSTVDSHSLKFQVCIQYLMLLSKVWNYSCLWLLLFLLLLHFWVFQVY